MSVEAEPGVDGTWRDTTVYNRLIGIDLAGVMWEWLRRDPGYVAWYTVASTATRGTASPATSPIADPTQWGIHFRRASGGCGSGCPDRLACGVRSRNVAGRRAADRRVGPGRN